MNCWDLCKPHFCIRSPVTCIGLRQITCFWDTELSSNPAQAKLLLHQLLQLSYKLHKYKSYQTKIVSIKRKSLPRVTYNLHISQFTPLDATLAHEDSPSTFHSLNSIKKYMQSDFTNNASYLHQKSISNTKKQRNKIVLSYRHLHEVDEDTITYFFPVSVHAVQAGCDHFPVFHFFTFKTIYLNSEMQILYKVLQYWCLFKTGQFSQTTNCQRLSLWSLTFHILIQVQRQVVIVRLDHLL